MQDPHRIRRLGHLRRPPILWMLALLGLLIMAGVQQYQDGTRHGHAPSGKADILTMRTPVSDATHCNLDIQSPPWPLAGSLPDEVPQVSARSRHRSLECTDRQPDVIPAVPTPIVALLPLYLSPHRYPSQLISRCRKAYM